VTATVAASRGMWGMAYDSLFTRIIDACELGGGPEATRAALARVAKAHGFDQFAFLYLQGQLTRVYSNYPPEWLSRYFDRSYSTIDPIVEFSRRQRTVFNWSVDGSRTWLSGEQRHFYREAADFGIRCGISVPVRIGFGHLAILTLASSVHHPVDRDKFDPLTALVAATMVHGQLVHDVGLARKRSVLLSNREANCLRWIAEGKRMFDIADIEEIKFGTVRDYLDGARAKLSAVTLAQATWLAGKLAIF
jgi:LuxR family transcriptional activator of conjugal transfer of Ti plasmids